jgi:hypothetical protein
VVQVEEHLPKKCKALSSKPQYCQKKRKKRLRQSPLSMVSVTYNKPENIKWKISKAINP